MGGILVLWHPVKSCMMLLTLHVVEEQHFIYVSSILQGLRNQVNEQIQSNQSIISLIQERISNQTQIEEEKNTGKGATG